MVIHRLRTYICNNSSGTRIPLIWHCVHGVGGATQGCRALIHLRKLSRKSSMQSLHSISTSLYLVSDILAVPEEETALVGFWTCPTAGRE